MHQSHLVSLQIARPAAAVYAYLAEPGNFPEWVLAVGPEFRQIGALEWAGSSSTGELIVRLLPGPAGDASYDWSYIGQGTIR